MKQHIIPQNQFPLVLNDHVSVLGNYFINLFLVKGSRATALFEVGISSVVDTVIRQLNTLNCQPDLIIVSHPHSDHITGLPGLMSAFPASRIIAAQGAKEFIAHPKALPLLLNEDAFMHKRLKDFDLTPGRPPLDVLPDLSRSTVVRHSQTLDLGEIQLELTVVGGHSPGNLIGWIPQSRTLFCSDSLGFHYPGRRFLPLFFTRADRYLTTLEQIKARAPSIVCPAHQGPLTRDAAGQGIEDALIATHEIIDLIRHSTLSDTDLAEKIFKDSYRDEFTLYTPENIRNCADLLVKRAKAPDRFPSR